MTNATQANAQFMTGISRRTAIMAGLTTTLLGTMIPASASADQAENASLIDAYGEFEAALAEYQASRNSLEWLADEWRHRWPLAPDLMTFPHAIASDNQETDIVGRPIRNPETGAVRALLPLEHLKKHATATPRPFPARMREGEKRRRLKYREDTKTAYRAGKAYYAETARLREVSGANVVRKRLDIATEAVLSLADKIEHLEPVTLAGVVIKAKVYVAATGVHNQRVADTSGKPIDLGALPLIGPGYGIAKSLIALAA
ncbi:MAG: hypothetical protein K5872_06530 [Rhizobiaceae bacterium]|nr:hypothetical protein [Rhizobiaceae bacterium]MCV0405869.1 hypothetical protein [Rhizobiaceae bacterium]